MARREYRPGGIEIGAIALIALVLRLVHLDHTPYIDEIYHMLAAKSLLADGTLTIPGGLPYDRAWGFTYLVAAMMRLFGEGLVPARLVAVAAGTGLVVAVFLWVGRQADRTAAWTAGLLLAAYPAAIQQSQFVRFYSLQVLMFFLGAIGVYALAGAVDWRPRRHVPLAVGTLSALALATHFQILSLVGIGALAIWVLLVHGRKLWNGVAGFPGGRFLAPIAIVLGAIGFFASPVPRWMIEMTNRVDLWAIEERGEFRMYHRLLLDHYPTLWTLFPLIVLVALCFRPRPAFFCATVFGTALAYHSIAAWKVERYIFYVMPLFFALVGFAFAVALPPVTETIAKALRTIPVLRDRPRRARWVAVAAVSLALLFAVASNGAFRYTWRMLTTDDANWPYERLYRGEADWAAAAPDLIDRIDASTTVVSSSGPKALYFLDRLDYILVANELPVVDGMAVEFGANPIFRRPVISAPESLERLVDCQAAGLIVVERKQFGKRFAVPWPARRYILEHTQEVELDPRFRLRAFEWHNDSPADDARCSGLAPVGR